MVLVRDVRGFDRLGALSNEDRVGGQSGRWNMSNDLNETGTERLFDQDELIDSKTDSMAV